MKQFTLKDPKELPGEPADIQKYGHSYWSYTHDSDVPVMFNLMEGSVQDGTTISAETIELKTSSKGTEYLRLKKVKVDGPVQNVTSQTQINTSDDRIDTILETLEEVVELLVALHDSKSPIKSGYEKAQESRAKLSKEDAIDVTPEDVVVDDIGDEPINLDDIPF